MGDNFYNNPRQISHEYRNTHDLVELHPSEEEIKLALLGDYEPYYKRSCYLTFTGWFHEATSRAEQDHHVLCPLE